MSNIFQPQPESPQKPTLKVHHITGLGFKEGEEIKIFREANDLIFQGKVEKEWEEVVSGSLKIYKKGMVEETKKLIITDIEGLAVLDESGRGLGRMGAWAIGGDVLFGKLGLLGGALVGMRKFKGFIVIQAKSDHNFTYQILLGGESQKEIRNKYDKLIELLKN